MKNPFSKLFRRSVWKPREGLVYKSWSKTSSHYGKEVSVTIILDDNQYKGSFKVSNGSCEIRMGRRIVTPSENVSFTKNIEHINTYVKYGQNGYAGTEIKYTAKILNPKLITELTSP